MTIVRFCSRFNRPSRSHDLLARGLIEVAGRLVGQQHLRAGDQRPGDRRPLHFAARQLARLVLEPVAEADQLEQLAGPLAVLRARRSQ